MTIKYILPKMSKSISKRVTLPPGQERSVTVHIRSLRNPPFDIKLKLQSLHTSILDLKTLVAQQANLLVDKIKLLHRKKPVADSKVLKDLLADDEINIEFSMVVMGGASATSAVPSVLAVAGNPEEAADAHAAQGVNGKAVLESDAFWADLKGFLLQRIRDVDVTEELFARFLLSRQTST